MALWLKQPDGTPVRVGGSVSPAAATIQTYVQYGFGGGTFEKADYPGLVYIEVAAIGGGGGGGGAGACAAGEVSCGAGGGAGGTGWRTLLASELADVETIVGAEGGLGATTSDPGDATAGGTTTAFGITAAGGDKGSGTISLDPAYANALPGQGGTVSGTYNNRKRGDSGSPPTISPGALRNWGGNGAATPYGRGGRGGNGITSNGGSGSNGSNGGGGGGGVNRSSATSNRGGGDGGAGRVYIWIYTAVPAVEVAPPGEWTAFTPEWTNLNVGNALTNTGVYQYVPGGIRLQVRLNVGGADITGSLGFVLPFGLATNANSINTMAPVRIIDSGGTVTYIGLMFFTDNDTTASFQVNGSNAGITATSPMTWASNDSLRIDITVPLPIAPTPTGSAFSAGFDEGLA